MPERRYLDDEATGQSAGRWSWLRGGGVMVVVEAGGPWLPAIVYWGRDLGELTEEQMACLPMSVRQAESRHDPAAVASLSPTRAQGWAGWPGLSGHRGGQASQPLFSLERAEVSRGQDGSAVFSYSGRDPAAGLVLEGELALSPEGLLRHRQRLTSAPGDDDLPPYEVADLPTLLPVPGYVTEVMDFAGRWANEAQPQRRELAQGTWLREQRRGRTGADSPLVLCAGTTGFSTRQGEVWAVHLAWSGDQRYLAQRLNTGTTLLGVGEILAPGEVLLGPGEALTTPWAYAAYSSQGLDGVSARFHSFVRHSPAYPRKPRPVVFNTWEAVTFQHSFERLARLADLAAQAGAERFVIDDGWFGSRRDDTSGLGDWYVSKEVWPEGLGPIVEHVRSLGMDFGLWFEPEMVNLDSDLARAHPEWVLGAPGRMPPPQRNQQVLDVSVPEAFEYVLERISSLVDEYGIDFVKWDHNRDVADPVHRSGPRAGLPAARDLTLATYRLIDTLHQRFPALEIESCSSGAGRVDLGILARTQRIWASDCTDPLERSRIVPGLATLVPLEMIGTHVASPRNNATARYHDLPLRLIIALFGHQGIEWDLESASAEEREALARWVSMVKRFRGLVHSGQLVRAERPRDPGTSLFGVVAQDRSEGLFALVRAEASPYWGTTELRLAGLDPSAHYRVERVAVPGEAPQGELASLPPVELHMTGEALMAVGAHVPALLPEQASLWHVVAEGP